MQVRTHQNDTVDALCWRHLGRTERMVEATLELNPGLAAADPVLADIYLPSGAWQMLGSRISLSLPTAGVRYDLPPFRAVQFRPS